MFTAIYMSNHEAIEVGPSVLPGIELLSVAAKSYVKDNVLQPRNPSKWNKAFKQSDVPFTYSTNFEIVKVDFFRKESIRKWSEYILANGGIYKYRWGDAPLRYVTLSIFADEKEVLHRSDYDIDYCHPC